MKPNKVFGRTILVLALLMGGGSVFGEESCDPPIDGILGQAALDTGKASPPEGCMQVWQSRLASSEIKNDGVHSMLVERWELIAREIFVGCYRKGELGVDTEKRYIPASTESVLNALCTVSVACDENIPTPSEEIHCGILQ